MSVTINGDTGIDKITDGSVVNADIASGIDAAKLTGTLPAIDGSALTGISSYADSDALTLFNASGSAPVYACRAWVSLNGTGTIAINGSGNVSSIVDVGTGRYTVNLTTAIQDVNYAVTTGGSVLATQTTNEKTISSTNIATSSFMLHSHDSTSNTYADSVNVFGAVFR